MGEKNDIYSTAIQLAEIVIIKRDFDILRKLVLKILSPLNINLFPTASLLCYEELTYLMKYDEKIQFEQTSQR